MFTRKRTRSAPISGQVALALLVVGPALFIWGQQSQAESFERMIDAVGDISVITGPEAEAAYADYVADNDAIIQGELTRFRLTFLASVAGAGCWCTGILIVAHRIHWSERTVHPEPACDAPCAAS